MINDSHRDRIGQPCRKFWIILSKLYENIFFWNIAKIGIVLRIMMRQIHSFCCILSIQAYFMNFVLVIFWQKWLVILFGNFNLSKTKDLCLRYYLKFWNVVYLAKSNTYINSVYTRISSKPFFKLRYIFLRRSRRSPIFH